MSNVAARRAKSTGMACILVQLMTTEKASKTTFFCTPCIQSDLLDIPWAM